MAVPRERQERRDGAPQGPAVLRMTRHSGERDIGNYQMASQFTQAKGFALHAWVGASEACFRTLIVYHGTHRKTEPKEIWAAQIHLTLDIGVLFT